MSPSSPTSTARPRAISRWLLAVAAMVLLMVLVGGITRLTESGLSMVRWEPISGTVPPLNADQWNAEFAAYKATPEYAKVNHGMSLAEFKQIFFWEYLHRLIGRLIGVVFAVPLIWFAWKKAIPRGYGSRLTALLALGGLQGAIGWWMVASGLIDRPDVSHIRLAIHLSAALFIFAGLIWTALDLRALTDDPRAKPARMPGIAAVAIAILTLQIMLGAFTAGLDAGFAFAEWPTMGGRFFPEGVPLLAPAWRNLVDQPIVVQFVHRWFAWVTAGAAIFLAIRAKRAGVRLAWIIHALVTLQICLGIATLLSGVAIPIAVAHQLTAALLLAALIIAAHCLGSVRK
jgi:cytochrome c oxidase assembly protein subunit 15